MHWRQTRAYVVADRLAWRADDDGQGKGEEGAQGGERTGTLTVGRC